MEKFLSECRNNLGKIVELNDVCVTIGNEACDLDSVTCALLHAKYLSYKGMHSTTHIPVLNIPREDFLLKTEVAYLLKRLNISTDVLIFRDEIPLNDLLRKGALKLVLVDHNVLSTEDMCYDDTIVEIVDHHKIEHAHSNKIKMVIEPVGSCSTLIASFMIENAPELLDLESTTLLLGAITLDVANFSSVAKRATLKDEQVTQELRKLFPGISVNSLYEDLQNAKQNVSHLSHELLFRKDAKTISVGGISIVICGLPFCCSELAIEDIKLFEKLRDFSKSLNREAVVVMGITIDYKTDVVKRDIVVYSQHVWLRNQICQALERDESKLKLSTVKSHPELSYYHQGNVLATRKIVLPLLKDMLAKLELPVDNSTSVKTEGRRTTNSNENMEGSPNCSSGIETPTNSCDEEPICGSATGSAFHSAEDVMARLHSKKLIASPSESGSCLLEGSDPFTPENSYAEENFDQCYRKFVLNQIDTEALSKKLSQENFFQDETE